ncbi:hypothetical protein [uncultured Clostridium sp.]|jgi:hypothetical protein|uniref:hypothetical protein n=1 Tax=uncultured Clostridium sp. TaxID=59620 RepID=UPI002605BBB7|nr:hypothetical protein [uncultured Clostridium sp.]
MRNRRRTCSRCCEPKCYQPDCCENQNQNIMMPTPAGAPTNLFTPFTPMSGGTDPTSYATFWNTCPTTVDVGDDFEFNQAGVGTSDVTLISQGTIRVCRAGVYHITYRVNVSLQGVPNSTELIRNRVSLYINCMQQPNGQAGFSIQTPDITSCMPINGDALVFIPANSCLNLVNESQCIIGSSITTCTSGGSPVNISLHRVN